MKLYGMYVTKKMRDFCINEKNSKSTVYETAKKFSRRFGVPKLTGPKMAAFMNALKIECETDPCNLLVKPSIKRSEKIPWELKHYELLFSCSNADEFFCKLKDTYPEMSVMTALSKWDHKSSTTRESYDRLKKIEDDKKVKEKEEREQKKKRMINCNIRALPLEEKVVKIRDAILSLNLTSGDKIPFEKLFEIIPAYLTMPSLRSLVSGTGYYGSNMYKDRNYFSDIVCKKGGEIIFKPSKIPLSKTIIIKPLVKSDPRICGEDDDIVKLLNRSAEQIQLLKEIVKQTKDTGDTIISAMNKNAEVISDLTLFMKELREENIRMREKNK